MPTHRKPYSAKRSRERSRQVRQSTVGTHVAREGRPVRRESTLAEGIARRARVRRFAVAAVAIVIVLAVALGAGFCAFRGVIGSEMALKDSDVQDALVPVKSGAPSYTLVSVELGAAADPLDNGGPDVFLLARLDPESGSLAIINIPPNLQVTSDNSSSSLASIAHSSDAALVRAVSTATKVDISHFVKIDEAGLVGMLDVLSGVDIDVEQAIDDPHAGSVFVEAGQQSLSGESALVYLRAQNVKLGQQDQLTHQLTFATGLTAKVFAREGSFAGRIESIDSYFQTDYSLGDLEDIYSWLGGVSASDITCVTLPGYYSTVTNASASGETTFEASASDVSDLIDALENGRDPSTSKIEGVTAADPGSFTVEVQNGTDIPGAAATTAETLRQKGFNVGEVGNAEQTIYDETLVVYKGEEGKARAKAVIEAIGSGRAVSGDAYYKFDDDVLLIIGGDYKPVS